MATQVSNKQKLYLYAVTAEREPGILGAFGIDGGTVFAVTHGRVSAVVSEVVEKLRPERRHLATHQDVLKRLMSDGTAILPVAFGVIAEGVEAIRGILTHNQKTLREQLRHVDGRIEMSLRVTWDVPNIFEYFVDTHAELRAARDSFFGGHREPSQDDKIELGRLFERLLSESRDEHAERVEEVLAPHCVEIKRNPPRTEREAIHLACLVERERQGEFEQAVFEVARDFDSSSAFDYSGPWPPHNFVDLSLELHDVRARAHARA